MLALPQPLQLPLLLLLVLGRGELPAAESSHPRGGGPYVPDPEWHPSVPSSQNITGVSSCALGLGDDSSVYVGQRGKGAAPIQVLDSRSGKYLRSFGAEADFHTVHGMHMQLVKGSAYLWVTDAGAGKVHKFDATTGKLLLTVGSKGTGLAPLQFGSVADVAFDDEGSVYISDGDGGVNARILKLDSKLELVWAVGNNGTVASKYGPFKSPHSIAVSADSGIVYVADRNNNQLRSFNSTSGLELRTPLRAPFASPECAKPAVWSVRTDDTTKQLFVAHSTFGSGSACPSCAQPSATCHAGEITVLPAPVKAPAGTGAAVPTTLRVPAGFPHEICVDGRDGSVFSAAVDSSDLPAGQGGILALTKYKPGP